MWVIDKLNCAVVPICKAGSSSLVAAIAEEAYDEEYIASVKAEHKRGHNARLRTELNKDFAKRICDPKVKEEIKNYFKFSFVKNPWHRIASACLQLRKWMNIAAKPKYKGNLIVHQHKALPFSRLRDLLKQDYSFENFVHFVKNIERNHAECANQHWRSQVESLRMEEPPPCKTEYDFIGRLESAQEDYFYIADKLKFKNKTFPIRNRAFFNPAKHYDYKEFYTNTKLIDDVGDYYARDIEVFKYEFGK